LEANFNFGNFFSKFKIDSQGTLEPTWEPSNCDQLLEVWVVNIKSYFPCLFLCLPMGIE
jgi:hypothetical protein